MAPKQTLGDYLKRQEACWDARLPSRLPYVVRLDGRGFHRWVKQTGCEKPFDHRLGDLMARTLRFTCEQMGVAAFGYTQSDEMSILVREDLKDQEHEPWFDGREPPDRSGRPPARREDAVFGRPAGRGPAVPAVVAPDGARPVPGNARPAPPHRWTNGAESSEK